MAIRSVEEQPTGQDIQDAYDEIQSYWFPAQSDDDELFISLYENTHEVWIPDTAAEGRIRKIEPERMDSSEGKRTVNLVRSFYVAPSEIDLEWVGATSPKSSEKGEKLALGINEIINQLNQPGNSPILAERFWMILLGRAARLIAPGDAYYWDFPDRKEGQSIDDWWKDYSEWRRHEPLPLVWLDLNPAQTFPTSFGRMEEELVNWTDLTLPELQNVFSEKELEQVGGEDYHDGEGRYRLLTYANVKHLSYAIMGRGEDTTTRAIRHHEHTMGRPAIRILHGEVSGIKEPGRYWLSVLEPVKKQIPQVDRRLSEAATASNFDALPMFKGRFQDGSDVSKIAKFFAGDIIPLAQGRSAEEPGEDLEPLFHPEFGEKTLALAQFGLSLIERQTGATAALEGAHGPSGETAWARNFSHDVATAKFSLLTDAVVASDVDAADSIMRAIASFGETVRIPVHPGHGKKSPTIKISPSDMENFRPTLKGDYRMRVPLNLRADLDLMVNLIERVMQNKLPVSIPMIMSKLGGIEDPFHQFEESRVWAWMLSPEADQLFTKTMVKEVEGDLAGDEGMDIEEFMRKSENWPAGMRAAVLQEVMGTAPPPGNGDMPGVGGMTPATAGAMRAGQRGTVKPGGGAPTDMG